MKNKSLVFIILIIIYASNSYGQNYSKMGKLFFNNYLSEVKFYDLSINSMPTLEDCKFIFVSDNAFTYYGYSENLQKKLKKSYNKLIENKSNKLVNYYKIEVNTISSNVFISQAKNHLNSTGMYSIANRIKPDVIFYVLTIYKNKDDKDGDDILYWVNINSKWVYFHKPWQTFNN